MDQTLPWLFLQLEDRHGYLHCNNEGTEDVQLTHSLGIVDRAIALLRKGLQVQGRGVAAAEWSFCLRLPPLMGMEHMFNSCFFCNNYQLEKEMLKRHIATKGKEEPGRQYHLRLQLVNKNWSEIVHPQLSVWKACVYLTVATEPQGSWEMESSRPSYQQVVWEELGRERVIDSLQLHPSIVLFWVPAPSIWPEHAMSEPTSNGHYSG